MERILFLLLVLPILSLAQPVETGEVKEPYIEVGDSWTYRGHPDGEYELKITFTDDKTVLAVQVHKNGKEVDSTWTRGWNPISSQSGRLFKPYFNIFQFPLKVGDKHKIPNLEVSRKDLKITENWYNFSSTVIGWESVDVPAGRFLTLKIEVIGTIQSSQGSRPAEVILWYSPRVKRYVKLYTGGPKIGWTEELTSYKLVD